MPDGRQHATRCEPTAVSTVNEAHRTIWYPVLNASSAATRYGLLVCGLIGLALVAVGWGTRRRWLVWAGILPGLIGLTTGGWVWLFITTATTGMLETGIGGTEPMRSYLVRPWILSFFLFPCAGIFASIIGIAADVSLRRRPSFIEPETELRQ